MTGEADLIRKNSGDRIHAGGRQVGQAIELEVVKDIEQSYLTRLWNNDIFSKDRRAPLTALVDRISARFTYAVLLIAGLSGFTAWCRGSGFGTRTGAPGAALFSMAARNTSWNPRRSILSVALVASACFVIATVAANRGELADDLLARDSPSGGFGLNSGIADARS